MKAIASYIKLQGEAAYVKLRSEAAYVKLRAETAYVKLHAEAAYVKLQTLVTYQHLSAEVQYILMKATAITGKFIDFLEFSETLTEIDAATVDFSKQLNDIAALAEQINIGTSTSFDDTQALNDVIFIATTFNQFFDDTTGLSDYSTVEVGKGLFDNLPQTDQTSFAVSKSIADSLAIIDSAFGISFVDEENDALAIDDLGVDDDPAWDLSKNLVDATSTSDSGLLIMQDYCDITYFAADYVGQSRTF